MDNKKEPETNEETTATGGVGQPVVVTDGELQDSDLAKVSGGATATGTTRVKTADKMAKAVDTFIRG